MTDRSDWPQWLKDADTVNAEVEVHPITGYVVWNGGVWNGGKWLGGIWRSGIWRGGVWHGGVWHGGVWCGGVWRNGDWHGGVWCGGEWHGGVWCGGEWHSGVWHSGEWQSGWSTCNRAPWTVLSNGKGDISFGCKVLSLTKAKAIAAGTAKAPSEAPDPKSIEAQMLRASLAAQIEYDRVMAEWEESE